MLRRRWGPPHRAKLALGYWMRGVAALPLVLFLGSGTWCAGQGTGSAKFEVASVKYAGSGEAGGPSSALRGGPGTPEPQRITYHRQPLARFLAAAYGVDFDQISGPGWMGSEFYDVDAVVPPGTTKEQLRVMWQNLLSERFHLKAHLIRKEFPVYELTLAGKGPKLRKAGESPYKQEPGFPVVAPGSKRGVSFALPLNIRQTFRDCTMAEFIQYLGWPLGTLGESGGYTIGRIVDKTGLQGTYHFTFEFAGSFGPGEAFPPDLPDGQTDTAPSMFDALRDQLGPRRYTYAAAQRRFRGCRLQAITE